MPNSAKPKIYWSQNETDIFFRINIINPKTIEIHLEERCLTFSASNQESSNLANYNFSLEFFGATDRAVNKYEVVDRKLQFILRKKSEEKWPSLTSSEEDPSWIIQDIDKSHKKINEEDRRREIYERLSQQYGVYNEKVHREEFEDRDFHQDYPKAFEELQKEELGYKKEDLKKVYLVIYNLCQFVGFIYILTIMAIRYSREGPESMRETYSSLGNVMKFMQLLQFLEVMHPMFGYTKGNAFVALLQVGGRAFILFSMIDAEPRMQTKPVVFYVFFVWSMVEIFRYPYYVTQLLNSEIPLLTWFRYTIWIPLYPLGFLCEGIIVLRNIPYFEETQKFTVSLPNDWNFAFHFPTFLRIYLLVLAIPGMYTMMSHMNQTRYKKLAKSKGRKTVDNKDE